MDAQGHYVLLDSPRTWVDSARDRELALLERLVGLTVVEVKRGDGRESPTIILQNSGELFEETLELSKRHEFEGPNVQSFYCVEDVS